MRKERGGVEFTNGKGRGPVPLVRRQTLRSIPCSGRRSATASHFFCRPPGASSCARKPKMLIGLEGAHAFCVNIFGRVEHLR